MTGMKKAGLAIAAAAIMSMPSAVPARMGMMQGRGMMGMSRLRHQYARQHGIDPKYASLAKPMPATAGNLAEGRRLYRQDCAVCHGASRLGDGEAGRNLNPPPSNLLAALRWPFASDAYLYWAIAEGGAPIGSAMPPFKNVLKAEQIRDLILYLRSN